ncbi:MAG: SMI1/KNR4 family protein [Opitutaceae bacterium]|jgi:hypothetical protein|nr:SMI1/KNR4 family protein [Opitutaceae bacterium]
MKNLDDLLSDFNGNAGASPREIKAALDALKLSLPSDYIAFLEATNGGEGMIGETYLILWKAGELQEMNVSYQVSEYAPEILLIGSDGGGEAFAFDTRASHWPVVKVPFVGMELDCVEVVAPSFDAFLKGLAG